MPDGRDPATAAVRLLTCFGQVLPAQSRAEIQKLLSENIRLVERLLLEGREILPFSTALDEQGALRNLFGCDPSERTSSLRLIEKARTGMAKRPGDTAFRVTAVVYDVRVASPDTDDAGDAIAMELNHADGAAITVYVPYAITRDAVSFGDRFAQKSDSAVSGAR